MRNNKYEGRLVVSCDNDLELLGKFYLDGGEWYCQSIYLTPHRNNDWCVGSGGFGHLIRGNQSHHKMSPENKLLNILYGIDTPS